MAQEIPAARFTNLVASTVAKTETFLASQNYSMVLSELSNDTVYKTYEFRPAKNKKQQKDSAVRSIVVANLKDQYDVTYHTSSHAEYLQILASLKKQGFQCDYDNEATLRPTSYLYQYGDQTAELQVKDEDGQSSYCIKLHRQAMPGSEELQTADDLLKFTSHEYLVHYFGEKNVKKDLFYFAENDVVNCSVLFMNTNRQVIFVWKDAMNRRTIDNLIFGGQNKLKSQQGHNGPKVQNQWRLKNGLRPGMHLVELRNLNKKEILFCGGNAPNPGLILPESSGEIDFHNTDVVLSCVNCTDEKFLISPRLGSDVELNQGRILFVLSVVLYPPAK